MKAVGFCLKSGPSSGFCFDNLPELVDRMEPFVLEVSYKSFSGPLCKQPFESMPK